MDLRRLRHFSVAAEAPDFRRAARRLDTNQASISRHVRDIENGLDHAKMTALAVAARRRHEARPLDQATFASRFLAPSDDRVE